MQHLDDQLSAARYCVPCLRSTHSPDEHGPRERLPRTRKRYWFAAALVVLSLAWAKACTPGPPGAVPNARPQAHRAARGDRS